MNTFFPVAAANAGVDINKIELVNVAESALVQSYLQNMAPAMLGGIDDKPAEIEANGGQPPVIFNYADYGVYQPGYAIATHKDLVKENPDLVRSAPLTTPVKRLDDVLAARKPDVCWTLC